MTCRNAQTVWWTDGQECLVEVVQVRLNNN
jgi:hypothetical protein